MNVGTGKDASILELAKIVSDVIGYKGVFTQDISKPDGTMRKILDVSKIQSLGWKPRVSLRDGISLTYKKFI